MNRLLTVAVPTYNRVEKLRCCMERLLAEVKGRDVEILVSDNASTDGTDIYMNELCLNHPEITYARNAENVGPDRNFLNCYERASGEYVLLLGDDDMLLPGAVDSILEALGRKPVFVHLNTSNLKSFEPLTYTAPRVPEGHLKEYYSKDDLMKDMGIFVTFLSAMVLRTELVREIQNKEQYIGTYFIQSHIALKTLSMDGLYLFVTKNCIAATENRTLNYDVCYVWGMQYRRLLLDTAVEAGMDREILRKLHKRDLKTVIYGFVKYFRTACGSKCAWEKSYILDEVRKYPVLFLRYLRILYFPVWIMKLEIKIGWRLKKYLVKRD